VRLKQLPFFSNVGAEFFNAETEGDILYAQKLAWEDPNNEMQSWDPTLFNPRTWFHMTFFFFRITQYNEDAHNMHAHSHPMNTRTQTLPLWAPPKDWAPADLKIPEVTTGASSSTGMSFTT